MRSVLVVVDPASPPSQCVQCKQAFQSFRSRHVCEMCGMPQPVLPTEDYFSALGVARGFNLNRSELEKRFYELSRVLHPDRFAALKTQGAMGSYVNSPAAQQQPPHQLSMDRLSMERMSFLNQAYSTLKSPAQLREYLLQLEGIQVKRGESKNTIPMELAESWFEIQDLLQDLLMEQRSGEPVKAGAAGSQSAPLLARLKDFEQELDQFKKNTEKNLMGLESEYDSRPSRAVLERLAKEIQVQTYLRSLERDVERIKNNAHSN